MLLHQLETLVEIIIVDVTGKMPCTRSPTEGTLRRTPLLTEPDQSIETGELVTHTILRPELEVPELT